MCPKTSDGKWECPEVWTDVFDSRYVEGDAWHYRWFVPQDIPGLIQMFGEDYFVEQLTEFFHRSEFFPGNFSLISPFVL
jgi:putative alpha-1,2-mannosidase